jgi:hypothetical protein
MNYSVSPLGAPIDFGAAYAWIRQLPSRPETPARGCASGADDNISTGVVRRLTACGNGGHRPTTAIYILLRYPDTFPV